MYLDRVMRDAAYGLRKTYVPKASGTASEATSMAAIAVRITKRAGITSSAGTALVSHAYPPHAHHNTASSAAPWIIPTQVR
jgi:hypothetical protein